MLLLLCVLLCISAASAFYQRLFPHAKAKLVATRCTANPVTSNDRASLLGSYGSVLVGFPVLALAFPPLLSHITDFSVAPDERSVYILSLLLLKRIYIYSLAIISVDMIAKRSFADVFGYDNAASANGFGTRLMKINAELFGNNTNAMSEKAVMEKEVYNQIDTKISGLSEAVFIPLAVASSLLVSYFFLQFTSSSSSSSAAASVGLWNDDIIKYLILSSNFFVCLFFSKTELRNYIQNLFNISADSKLTEQLAFALGLLGSIAAVTSLPTADYWPLFNIINVFIAITVGRAVQIPQLNYIIISLLLLVAYDYVAVSGIQQFTDNGVSIMESIATAKSSIVPATTVPDSSIIHATSATIGGSTLANAWKPGLLQVNVNNKVTDVLGLGDIVFPSMLAGYTYRNNGGTMYSATITGYFIGCFMCEVFQTGQGQPALLYIVPSMLIALGIASITERLKKK